MLLNMKIILRALQLYKKQILPINILFKDLNKSLEVGSGGWSFGHNLGPNVRLVVGFPQRRENNAFHKCRLWSIYKFGNKLDKVIHSLSILFWTLLLDLLSLDSDPLLSDTASPLLNLDPLLLDLYLCLFQRLCIFFISLWNKYHPSNVALLNSYHAIKVFLTSFLLFAFLVC